MNSHLVILANQKPLTLPKDLSLSLEFKNPIFNDTEMFSYPVSLPIEGNRHLLKNIDEPNADARPLDYEHTPMHIIPDGVPLASGIAIVQEDEAIEDSLSLNIDASTQSFQDLISDLQCREIPIPSEYHASLLIGEKIDEVNVQIKYHTDVVVKYQGKKGDKKQGTVGEYTTAATFSPQALGFSYPAACEEVYDEHGNTLHIAQIKQIREYPDNKKVNMPEVAQSYINVSDPYPIKPFCNARVCYGHHDIEDGATSDKLVEYPRSQNAKTMYEDYGKLWVLDADRPQSGICFYVLFFLDCLFKHLGVSFDNSALTAIEDFKRLCFFTTKCAYSTEPLYYGSLYTENDPEVIAGKKKAGDIKLGFFQRIANSEKEVSHLFDEVNEWLDSRGCGGQLSIENPRDKTMQELVYYPVTFRIVEESDPRFPEAFARGTEVISIKGDPVSVQVGKDGVASITTKSSIKAAQMSASVVSMYANEKNFPDESVSTIIKSLEQQFGIKFSYDYEQRKVTAYLIRDVFRQQNPQPRNLHAKVLSILPVTEKITGVRVGYSAESDAKEQKRNVSEAVKDYNTDYDYIDYDPNKTITNLRYRDIIRQVFNNQKNVFIDLQTGNKYRVKIDSNFTNANDMDPRLFEVAANKGVEIGDCSTINEDFVLELKSDFVPVSMVDVNYRKALDANFDTLCLADTDVQPIVGDNIEGNATLSINGTDAQTIMAAFVDEYMEHEFIKQYIRNPLSSAVADFYVTEELSLRESYDPSSTDDGNSPLQKDDLWGLSIAIMRGGGNDSTREAYDPNYDGFGNSKWRTVSGKYALTTDSIDPYGNPYDYNGKDEPGIGPDSRFSLKPRAWVQPEWADTPLVIDDPAVKNRGYVDTFLIDYIYFLLHRKKYRIKCLCTVAQLADIPNHWHDWWLIDGRKCLINKVNTDVSVTEGIGEVELEVYSL